MSTHTAAEIGAELVRLASEGKDTEFVDRYFSDDVVSVEGAGTDEMPAEARGLAAIRAKHAWWNDNHQVHAANVEGPFVGNRADQFGVRFEIEATPKGGERMQMCEIALYTVRDGKVVREEFLYRM